MNMTNCLSLLMVLGNFNCVFRAITSSQLDNSVPYASLFQLELGETCLGLIWYSDSALLLSATGDTSLYM